MPNYQTTPLPSTTLQNQYIAGVTTLTQQLVPYNNVLFDVQNEWNVAFNGEGSTQINQVSAIKNAIKAAHSSRLVVASMDQFGSANVAAGTVTTQGHDALGYHERRDNGTWYSSLLKSKIRDLIGAP